MRLLVSLLCLLLCMGCNRSDDPALAQIKKRTTQTHTFIGHSAKAVMQQVIAVLQDGGYIIKNVSYELGILTAELDCDIEKFSSKFWSILFSGRNARWKKQTTFEMNCSLREDEGKVRLRVNFLMRMFDNTGRLLKIEPIEEEEAYHLFFGQVQQGLLHSRM